MRKSFNLNEVDWAAYGLKPYRFFEALIELPFVEALYLYGSRARGDFDEWSDIDLAISCPRADEGQWRQIIDIAENADILVDVECTRLDHVKDEIFAQEITRDMVELYHA